MITLKKCFKNNNLKSKIYNKFDLTKNYHYSDKQSFIMHKNKVAALSRDQKR